MLRRCRWLGNPCALLRLSRRREQTQLREAHKDRMRQRTGWRFAHTLVPSIGITVPVTCAARSYARNSARSATAPGCTHFDGSAEGIALRFAGVYIVPGKIRFAVSPASLFSSATVRTRVASADLKVTYAPRPACGSTAVKLPIATMRPFPDFRSWGIAARRT